MIAGKRHFKHHLLLLALTFRSFTVSASDLESFRTFLEAPSSVSTILFTLQGTGRGGSNSFGPTTSLYRGKWQSNDFTLMELKTRDTAEKATSTNKHLLVGRSGEQQWSISGENVSITTVNEVTTGSPNRARLLSDAGESLLSEVLAGGIIQQKLGTLQWLDATNFSAKTRSGGTIQGCITKLEKGRVKQLIYEVSDQQDRKYIVDYDDSELHKDFPLPDNMSFSFTWRGVTKTIERMNILQFERAQGVMPTNVFLPAYFIGNSSNYSPNGFVTIYTNGGSFWIQNGNLTPVNAYAASAPLWKRHWFWSAIVFVAINVLLYFWLKRSPAGNVPAKCGFCRRGLRGCSG